MTAIDPAYNHDDPQPRGSEEDLAVRFCDLHAGAADYLDVARLLAKVRYDSERTAEARGRAEAYREAVKVLREKAARMVPGSVVAETLAAAAELVAVKGENLATARGEDSEDARRDTNLRHPGAYPAAPPQPRARSMWGHLTRDQMLELADSLTTEQPPRPALDAILPVALRKKYPELVLDVPHDACIKELTATLDGQAITPLVVLDQTRAYLRRENGEPFLQGMTLVLRGKTARGGKFMSETTVP